MHNILLSIIRFRDRVLVVGGFYNSEVQTTRPTCLVLLQGVEQELITASEPLAVVESPEDLVEQSVRWALMTQLFDDTAYDVVASSYLTTEQVSSVIDSAFMHLRRVQHEAPSTYVQ